MTDGETPDHHSPQSSDETITPAVQDLYGTLDHGDSARIAEAVQAAEANTSAEIIVKLSAATAVMEPMRLIARAQFYRLGLADLPLKNGVLLYISLNRHAVELVAGDAAAITMDQAVWDSAVAEVIAGFRTSKPANGIIRAIQGIAGPLAAAFPVDPTQDINLPDVSEDVP